MSETASARVLCETVEDHRLKGDPLDKTAWNPSDKNKDDGKTSYRETLLNVSGPMAENGITMEELKDVDLSENR